ncbi:MAG: DUF115 domain-containing protein [Proteobacteria bacterium]|nr:DUF115 domain-containing protein [Pseudomonadota bacterium]
MAERIRSLKDTRVGERCFVVGNGPSLNKMDLERFKNDYMWGSNKIYLLFDRISWRPSFYVAADRRVVPDISTEIERLMGELRQTVFFLPSLFGEDRIVKSHDQLYWYNEKGWSRSGPPEKAFRPDASNGVAQPSTVTVTALQLAVYLGFNPIYLIGCDTSYTVPSSVKFEGGDRLKIVSTQDDDPNHFDPSYFGKGSKYHDPRVDRMIVHYELSKQVCDSLGVSIVNATVGGKLEVFPRVDYRELF